MEMRINTAGYLEIKRGNEWKPQYCPFAGNSDSAGHFFSFCGDWCPLFGEPVFGPEHEGLSDKLRICQDRTLSGRISDERGKP